MRNLYKRYLAQYFAAKPLYLDVEQKEPNVRKLVEQPWQYSLLEETVMLYKFISHFSVFHEMKLRDYIFYERYLIKKLRGCEREKCIWQLFGLHIGDGEDFISAFGLLKASLQYTRQDFKEASREYAKSLYYLGWCRKNMDDLSGAEIYFTEVRELIIKHDMRDCQDILMYIK